MENIINHKNEEKYCSCCLSQIFQINIELYGFKDNEFTDVCCKKCEKLFTLNEETLSKIEVRRLKINKLK